MAAGGHLGSTAPSESAGQPSPRSQVLLALLLSVRRLLAPFPIPSPPLVLDGDGYHPDDLEERLHLRHRQG
jgi:hypothetical protein